MTKTLAVLIAAAALGTAALAGPQATTKAAKCGQHAASCPMEKTSASCADCPSAKAAAKAATCSECPSTAAAQCPAGGKMTAVKCGEGTKKIDVAKLTAARKYADYKGKRYYWACDHCAKDFKANPAAYAKRHTGFSVPKTATN